MFTGCELKLGGGRNKGEDKPTALPVALQSVERGDISSSLRLNGTLEARRELMIYSRSPGRLDELLVEEGDRIQNGQLLARLEDVEQRLRQERARASLAQQQSTLRRMEELRAHDMAPVDEYERLQLAVRDAEITLKQADLDLDYTRITAPFTGIIAERLVSLGDRLDQSRPLFRLVDSGSLEVAVWMNETDLRQIRVDQSAILTATAYPEENWTAILIRISPVVDRQSGKVKATFRIVDPARRLKPGQFVGLILTLQTHKNVILVPGKALVYEAGFPVVFTVTDTLAFKRRVQVGMTAGGMAEIVSGLSDNEFVVTQGQATLQDGAVVRVVDDMTTTESQ